MEVTCPTTCWGGNPWSPFPPLLPLQWAVCRCGLTWLWLSRSGHSHSQGTAKQLDRRSCGWKFLLPTTVGSKVSAQPRRGERDKAQCFFCGRVRAPRGGSHCFSSLAEISSNTMAKSLWDFGKMEITTIQFFLLCIFLCYKPSVFWLSAKCVTMYE